MRRHSSMLIPVQLPSLVFMAKGGASFVPMTSSRSAATAGAVTVWDRAVTGAQINSASASHDARNRAPRCILRIEGRSECCGPSLHLNCHGVSREYLDD